MRSIVEVGSSVPAFLGKLWKLVNDSETDHLISWSPGGKTFFIKNQADFARSLLPLYYKHNNMASFIRQLNMYGFHKITSVENGGLRYEKDEIEFSHPCFMKGHAYLLEHIKRKIANSKTVVGGEETDKVLVKPELMTKVLAEVKQMKGKQEGMDAKFSVMKQENEALWREVAVLRQKHIKQQQIVNNLIQFLMSLVQPSRSGNMSSHGVKRRYQLMINDAAHNLRFDQSPAKNPKMESDLLEDLNEETLEDGPTIHELGHEEIIPCEETIDTVDPSNFVTIEIPSMSPGVSSVTPTQYEVSMEDGEDPDAAQLLGQYQVNTKEQLLAPTTPTPVVTSPSPVVTSPSPDATYNFMMSPGATGTRTRQLSRGPAMSPSQYTLAPTADLRLPAEIFASDDSVSDATALLPDVAQSAATNDSLVSTDVVLNTNSDLTAYGNSFLAPQNIKVEKNVEPRKKVNSKTAKANQAVNSINLANIKTELQDWNIDNNKTLATVNNNGNLSRLQNMNRRDIFNNNEDRTSKYGSNKNNNDLDTHLDTMQSDLDSLRDLLRGDTYSFDANTLLGLFGNEDPFYGLNMNTADDRTKGDAGGEEPNQLMSYTGNVPDFGDFNLAEEGDVSQDGLPDALLGDASVLNTPQVSLQSPFHPSASK